MEKTIINTQPKRKLSFKRLFLALAMLAGISYVSLQNLDRIQNGKVTASIKPWFAPYVDVTATPRYAFEQFADKQSQKNLVLSFIVSSSTDACTPTWGSAYTLDEAGNGLDLDRRIARTRQRGGNVAISFGGQLNDELAVSCTDQDKLFEAYKTVVERYDIDTIDLDIEGEGLQDKDALKRRAQAVAKLQAQRRSEGKSLAVWMTLPVGTFGLTEDGTDAVSAMLDNNVDLAGVNAMTMDYGDSKSKDWSMNDASQKALIELHRQLKVLYSRADINLNDASLWAKIGATPMIGQNDIAGEIFTLDDAKGFNEFVNLKGLSRLSVWSANRDIQCGENYVNISVVSDSCSGVKQEKYNFSDILSNGFSGDVSSHASKVTVEDPQVLEEPDDPAQSPYQIWSESDTYLEGTKVVWHKNVYQAKWWTKGDIPDNPVLQSFETPWQLIGPVLPGEKPIPQPTLPQGTYPDWSGEEIYDEGQRVLFDEVPYQAKWWTQGDSPAAFSSNPDSSPWVPLTKSQIDEIIN